jgi:hypothetical protein
MIASTTCAVCGHTDDSGASSNRVGGADVCNRCYLGDAPQQIRARGWTFEIRQKDMGTGRESAPRHRTEAKLDLLTAPVVHLRCERRTFVWWLLGLITPGVKSGDPIFDRHVRVESETPEAARAFLRDEGVQSILLDMLGEGSWVTVTYGAIRIYSARHEYVEEARFSSEMCVLASHLSRLTS